MSRRPRYGIDAPTVMGNLALAGGALAVAAAVVRRVGALHALLPLAPTMIATAIALGAMALWMLVSSLWLKQIVRDRLLAERRWRGDERVLDIGCGRGLFAIGAGARVPAGEVVGLDRWQAVDLSGNTADAFRANAAAAGIADRVTVETGDARALPFADASFDVVGSMTAIHNIPDEAGRRAVIDEMWRVTRPGGQLLIFDIRHTRAYAEQLRQRGAGDVRVSGVILLWGVRGWRCSATKASLPGSPPLA